ncbi:phage tail protein [Larkinella harenae]
MATFAGSMVLGGLSYALTPKPKKQNVSYGVQTQNVAVRQSDLTRIRVYGHMRVARGFAHMEATDVNGNLHQILILCDGPIRSINEIWMDDYAIPSDWLDADGKVTQGRYKDFLTIRKHTGSVSQTADALAVTNIPGWTSDHRLQGIAYLYLILKKSQDVYPNGVPNVTALVEGQELYDPRIGGNRFTTNVALMATDYLRDGEYGYGVLDDDIDMVNVAAQASICDEIVTTQAEDAPIKSIDAVTNRITLNGDLLRFQFGDRVELLVSGGTAPGGLATGVSYYVIPYQIKDTPRILLATSLENALDKTAIDITSAGSGTLTIRKTGEPRYHGSGVIDTETVLAENTNNLVNSMAGRAVNVGGFWTLLAGAYRAPFMSLGIGDIRGSGMAFKNALSMSESFNVVKGLFISSLNNFQPSDYPATVYGEFVTQDNGLEAPKDINLPFTNRPTTAQRIAKIELFRGRQDIVFSADFSMKAIQLQPGDTVELDIARLGWAGKEFEITQFGFDTNNGGLICRLSLRETAEAIYNWESGEAITYDPAPNSNLPNPFLVGGVTGLSYSSRQAGTVEGDIVYSMVISWNQHPDAFVREHGSIEIQFKKSADTDWLPSFLVQGRLTSTDAFTSTVNVPYDIRVRAMNNLGVRSAWNYLYGAVVGSSGGVTETLDYGLVSETASVFVDRGSVDDTVSAFEDWGYVV